MKRKLHLLIIDPQNDFCGDLPDNYLPLHPHTQEKIYPALPVPGAHADMRRLAELIQHGGAGLTDITLTMDAHHRMDIAHTHFWRDVQQQQPVTSFTQITAEAVRAGKTLPQDLATMERTLAYLDALEKINRPLIAWPVHCEIGSWGQNIHFDIRTAYHQWEEMTGCTVNKISKGTNPWTEHYSALRAEVPDPADGQTQLNIALLDQLRNADKIYVAGQASSHCVKATVEDLIQYLESPIDKLVLIQDCMSAVPGFEKTTETFIASIKDRDAKCMNGSDVLQEWWSNGKAVAQS